MGYNITVGPDAGDIPDITCTANTDGNGDPVALDGVRLGNFNYDIARSVQSYNVPIKIAAQTNQGAFDSAPYALELKNVTEHHGHGSAVTNGDDCNNGGQIVLTQNEEHNGDLEYFKFELCDTACYPNEAGPANDYCFEVPSPWDTVVIE